MPYMTLPFKPFSTPSNPLSHTLSKQVDGLLMRSGLWPEHTELGENESTPLGHKSLIHALNMPLTNPLYALSIRLLIFPQLPP